MEKIDSMGGELVLVIMVGDASTSKCEFDV